MVFWFVDLLPALKADRAHGHGQLDLPEMVVIIDPLIKHMTTEQL